MLEINNPVIKFDEFIVMILLLKYLIFIVINFEPKFGRFDFIKKTDGMNDHNRASNYYIWSHSHFPI